MSRTEIPVYNIRESINGGSLPRELPGIVGNIPFEWIERQRWYGSKAKGITAMVLKDAALLQDKAAIYVMTIAEIVHGSGGSEVYNIPLALQKAGLINIGLMQGNTDSHILKIESDSDIFLLYDALADDNFSKALFQQIEASGELETIQGRFKFINTQALSHFTGGAKPYPVTKVRPLTTEQSNSSMILDDLLIIKCFRRLYNGINPDLEIPLFLTDRTGFNNMPAVAGYIEYHERGSISATVASLQNYIPNSGDCWQYTLQHLGSFYDFVLEHELGVEHRRPIKSGERKNATIQFADKYLRDVRRLGRITGDLHNALTSDTSAPDFAPEPITYADVQTWISRTQSYWSEVLHILACKSADFPSDVSDQIKRILSRDSFYLHEVEDMKLLADEGVWKTRYHNDYHLGQVLKTIDDFIIIDFEGEPARPLEERRTKQSPLKDVAGMLRSFNYAAYAALVNQAGFRADEAETIKKWSNTWEELVCDIFLSGYLDAAGGTAAGYLPDSMEKLNKVLSLFKLDKAFYEINYELNNRPDWIEVPLQYLVSLLN